MATITLYKDKINGVGSLLDDIIKSSNNLNAQLGTLKNTLQGVDSSTCNLQDTVDSISSSSKSEKDKVEDLKRLNSRLTEFIEMTTRRDASAKSEIERAKKDFYTKYSYLKPDCEKSRMEKIVDAMKKACEWCKEHWKEILIAIELVVAVVCLFVPGLQGVGTAILTHMLKGLLIGLAVGAIVGGISGYAQEGVGGIFKGALNGAKDGALMGAAFGGLGGFGAGLGTLGQCSTAINTLFNVSSVISVGMQGFDMLALGDMTMMRLSKDLGFNYNGGQIAAANAKAHSNPFYNAVQIGSGMTAAFTGGYKSTAKCFIAGTLVLTANGVVAIEMIKAGNLVYAADADTLEVSLKPVLETYIRETSELVHITVNGEEIVSTFDHPYYVKGQGFVNAVDLCIGYELINITGKVLTIEQIYREVLDNESEKVYNFKVEENHTYFVGEQHILVHNAGDGYSGNKADIVRENHENGKKYEAEQFSELKNAHPEAETQVPIKPMDANGNAMRSGGNYLDGIALDSEGNPFITEYKQSPTAPYTRNQSANGFANGQLNQDMVVVGEGAGVFKPGDVIPKGTPIITVRGK